MFFILGGVVQPIFCLLFLYGQRIFQICMENYTEWISFTCSFYNSDELTKYETQIYSLLSFLYIFLTFRFNHMYDFHQGSFNYYIQTKNYVMILTCFIHYTWFAYFMYISWKHNDSWIKIMCKFILWVCWQNLSKVNHDYNYDNKIKHFYLWCCLLKFYFVWEYFSIQFC